MRRAYVVAGFIDDDKLDILYAVCHSMKRADELCQQAADEDSNPNRTYKWYEVIEEDDE